LYLGEFRHSLDGKGRIILPSKFRESMKRGCVITKGQDRCLVIFDSDGWKGYAAQIRSLSQMDAKVRAFARSVFGSAYDTVPDSQGRVLVPQKLREYAGLEREVVIAGVDDHLEVWDAKAWDRILEEADRSLPEVSQSLAEIQHREIHARGG
jgi:MraZ protein